MSNPSSQSERKSGALGVSQRAQSMPRSAIREIMALAAGRDNVVHLEVGEPDFTTPAQIIDGAFAAVRAGATRYTPNAGMPRLRTLIAERVCARWKSPVSSDRVVVTTGAIGALFTAIALVADAGDEVLIPDPGWPNYASICHLLGVTPVRFALSPNNGFLPDFEEIESLITPRTKAIVFNTPCNPTGVVFSRDVMSRLGRMAVRHDVFLVSDEIYEDLVFESDHVAAAEVAPEAYVITVSGVSKTYAMTGWRIGHLVLPPGLSDHAASLQEPVTSCPSAPSQAAAIAALEGPQKVVGEFRDIYKRRRDTLVEIFAGTGLLPQVPRGAFYALIDISPSKLGSVEFAKQLLREKAVAVVPGRTFGPGCDAFVRVAFTTSDDQLARGLQLLRDHIG